MEDGKESDSEVVVTDMVDKVLIRVLILDLSTAFAAQGAGPITQGGVGIRMPDHGSVGRSGRQAWKKKLDLAKKKVWEVHTTYTMI